MRHRPQGRTCIEVTSSCSGATVSAGLGVSGTACDPPAFTDTARRRRRPAAPRNAA
ncbi:hypothetical protein ABZ454_03555 [Streptomyces sp. NPDC005803]|uniref:hypothetical protein n=1 Tax=Streptomyces sp. NPDC005803 TaxID=3154297 RepID=UPI0033F8EF3F